MMESMGLPETYPPITNSPRGYLISRFARASTSGGIVKPICFAVLRLITN
jgi:hypothetical protein